MLTTELLERRITKGRFTMPPLTATHAGWAREPHGGNAGGLYEYGGDIYFVPSYREGLQIHHNLSEVQKVVADPTGWHKDMTFASVDPAIIAGGLVAALKGAITQGYPKARSENRLIFG